SSVEAARVCRRRFTAIARSNSRFIRGANRSSPASKVWDIATGFCIQTLMVDRLYECTSDQVRILT
ncbi:hypothetical protein QT982_32450, partial [Microcoleus sp. herbarium2]